MQKEYHIPVLLKESVDGLSIKPDGIYIDVTFGGGGHSIEILKRLTTGKLIAFDQDEDAEKNAEKIMLNEEFKDKFIFFKGNFKHISNFIHYAGYKKVDGILADLGVSSHQFDVAERGFAFRLGGIPDMRMNIKAKQSSLDILNTYSESNLSNVFKNYGELKSAWKLSLAIVAYRNENPIKDLVQLNQIINETIKTSKDYKILAKVYQALRIETNKELEVLEKFLVQSPNLLRKGGRLVVISYHSLEDRPVKSFMKFNNLDNKALTDVFGRQTLEFKEITKKPIVPSEEEIERNSRARSAKLRIAEKL